MHLRYQSSAQKIVQARMWAQGLTIGVLITAGVLTHSQQQETDQLRVRTTSSIYSPKICLLTSYFYRASTTHGRTWLRNSKRMRNTSAGGFSSPLVKPPPSLHHKLLLYPPSPRSLTPAFVLARMISTLDLHTAYLP